MSGGTPEREIRERPEPELNKLPSSRERALLAARTIDDMRGRDTLVLEVGKIASWTDYLVIGTGASRRQICGIADEIEKRFADVGDRKIGVEGYQAGSWVVLDFGDVVIHLFDEEKRAYYQLERLWEDAERVQWEPAAAAGLNVPSTNQPATPA